MGLKRMLEDYRWSSCTPAVTPAAFTAFACAGVFNRCKWLLAIQRVCFPPSFLRRAPSSYNYVSSAYAEAIYDFSDDIESVR